jgi:outer membrane protein OmpA-like peptidoglycan-associated protein
MKQGHSTLILAVLGLWALTVLPLPEHAQGTHLMQDCREGRACTAAGLAKALFSQQPRTRSLGAQKEEWASHPAAVALQVRFKANSDAILPQDYAHLNELGKVLSQPQYATARVQIQGHTDNVGSEHDNQVLSQKRAESVRHYLLQHFPLNPANLTAAGYGQTDPIASNETPEGRKKNQRIQVVNLGE